ncbi:MAG: hypothetical protein A2Y92_06005 [Chloroflexi bacterium RBG_13_57_8]|nr:MAG: hypothetical protein A2Y92_06005 [Chloroflexi bacterium RBG_13_57_8]
MVIYQKSQAHKVPKAVQEYMRRKFNLPAEYLGVLRCLENIQADNGHPATSLSIFSPVKARENRLTIKTAADLGRYPEMVLFKGHIDSHGGIEVTDRRRPVWCNKSVT